MRKAASRRQADLLFLEWLLVITLLMCQPDFAFAIEPVGNARAEEGVRNTSPEEYAAGTELPLCYAENFRVKWLGGGAAVLTLGEKEQFLLLPKEGEPAEGIPAGKGSVPTMQEIPAELRDLPVIRTPVERVYLASSSAADLFLQADALASIRCCSTAAESWQIPELKQALESESILYAGKYSAPDYELLLEEACDLVVENTMILHKPQTREKLEALSFPVMLEYSSYEPHPLGRVEWIKVYGLLTGKLAEAEAFFEEQAAHVRSIETEEKTGKSIAFFHFAANGAVVVRRETDYVSRMIELAGGHTAFTALPEQENALSSVTIQTESFYAQARDADILIFNGTVGGEIENQEQFLSLSPLLADFRAVREGNVWCTEQSMFQRSSAAAGMIADFREILRPEPKEEQLQYLHRIR